MRKVLFLSFLVFTAFCLLISSPINGQDLSIVQTTVDDGNYTSYCHPNFGNFQIKGNLDGALSPGERVRLNITIKNNTGYDITALYGIAFENSPYVNVINPNCYDGIIGVRYSCPIESNSTSVNFDPFVVEVSQDAPCGEFIDFGVTFFYTTSSGICSTQCTEVYHFSLPVFSLNKPFVVSDEKGLFESANSQPIIGTATNGQSIGMFFGGLGGLYFAEIDLDGTPISGPTLIKDVFPAVGTGGAIYNFYHNRYELIEGDGDLIPQDGYGETKLLTPPPGTCNFQSIFSRFYDMESLMSDAIVLVAVCDDLHTYLSRYDASTYYLIDYIDLGVTKTYLDQQCFNSLAALYDDNFTYFNYFVAYEYNSYSSHKLKISKIRGDNLVILSTYEIDLGDTLEGRCSLAVNDQNQIVALACQMLDNDGVQKVFGMAFDKNLTPLYSQNNIAEPELGKYFADPVLINNYSTFYLITKESTLNTVNQSAKIRVGAYDFMSFPFVKQIYYTYGSNEWLSMDSIQAMLISDKLHYFWNDTRGSYPNNISMHYGEARTLFPYAPYDLNPNDDMIISSAYQQSLHPSIACKNNECLVAWRDILSGTPDSTIFYRRFNLNGTPLEPSPVPVFLENNAPFTAHTIVKNHNGNYEIFWKDFDEYLNQYLIAKWSDSSGMGDAQFLFYMENSDATLLDAVPAYYENDLVAVKDFKSGDFNSNLYLYLCPHSGSPSFVKVTDYDWQTDLAYAKIAKIDNAVYPYAVSWLEKNSYLNYSKLWFAYLDYDFTIVSDYPVLIEYWPNTKVGEFAFSANQNIVSFVFSFQDDLDSYTFQIRNYHQPLDPNAYISYDLRQRDYSGSGSPYLYPVIKWSGVYFDFSWVEEGPSTSSGTERLFFIDHLDECGNFISWPVRIGSFLSYMAGGYDFNYETARTKKGFLATYNRGSGSTSFNVHLTSLSWDEQSIVCDLFNTPPVVSTSGPFTIEYGSGVTLQGSATDDTAMGDYITYSGWDITQDGVPDFSGATASVTFEQLKQKGWLSPKTANVTLIAEDRRGERANSTTTLTVRDTTPPNVSVIFPNGGETLVNGRSYTILWSGSDNYKISSYSIYYCTDWNGSNGTWIPIVTGLPAATNSYDWTIPEILSSTCRIKVVAVDGAPVPNANYDLSDNNFYLIQATTSSIKTLILYSASRMENFYPGKSPLISEKLAKLISNGKVNGFVVDLDSVPGLSSFYSEWDLDPTNQTKANDIANAIRNYVKDLVNNTYTNCEYLVIVGDDRMVPFFRIQDATPGSYSENDYAGGDDCLTTVGSALCQNYYLTDNNYGDLGHFENGEWKEYETTTAGAGYMALPDLAIGRLVEIPEQIATSIDVFITLDGQITLDSLTDADIFTSGYTFLTDSATTIDSKYDAEYVVDHLLGDSWNGDQLKSSIFSHPHKINSINGHANHYTLFSPDRGVTSTEMNSSYPGTVLNGTVFYNVGCHSGLNVPQTFSNSYDLPEMMMEKGSLAYIGNTGFGWGLKQGSGYSEKLMELVTDKMLYYDMSSLGKSLIEAKREYFINDKRYDVFDEKVLFESTLYGLPMFKIVMRQNGAKEPPKDFSGPLGPDEEEVNGIKLKKQIVNSTQNTLLPPGVTELSLQFDFGPETYQLVTTPDGQYYKLNGKSNGEAGDSLQPLFTYESRLSGVVSHGVIFTGGSFITYNSFDPAVATPQSSSPIIPPEPIAPICGAFVPTVNVTHPKQPTSLTATDFTKMVVYTGYFDSSTNVETIFNTMNFSIYYSNSTDKTPPTIVDPGEGNNLHTLNGTLCNFSVSASDSGSGIYRVIVTYTDGISQWNSIDLNYNSSNSKWEGSLNLKRNITYFVQAVDNAGNVKVLSVNEGQGDINPETGLPYVVGARIFKVQLLDEDNDGMEDTWEIQHGLNPTLNDANGDLDYDGLTNYEEFLRDTEPDNADTDGDGDNDGSELHNGRNPLSSNDGKRITITVEKVGNDIVIHFEDTLGENSVIDGPYWIYRSLNDPHFDDSEILVTNPYPLPDGTTSYTDVGAGSGTETYYYTVVNARFNSPAPVIDAVVPSSGPTSGGTTISVYGSNFSNGATVKIGGINCTNVVVVNSTKITCTTPPNSSGPKDVVVTNLNGQFGTLTNGYTYY